MVRRIAVTVALACLAGGLAAEEPPTPAELAVAAGAPPAPAGWTAPRTSWGDPDLTGTWPLEFLSTRPERPANLGTKRYWSDEEYRKLLAAGPGFGGDYQAELKANEIGSGHWTEAGHPLKLTSLIVEPANGRYPPLTDNGRKLQAQMHSSWTQGTFDSIKDFNTLDRCLSRGMPTSMTPFPYNNGLRVFQAPGYVVIQLELIHETRIIPLDGRAAPPEAYRTYLGSSRGHWEGQTLVIETTNFNGLPPMNLVGPGGYQIPTSTQEHVTERLTRTGPDTIYYEATVDDPGVFAAPFKLGFPWHRDRSYQIFEYACHEGNEIVRNYIHATSPRFAAQRAATIAAEQARDGGSSGQ
jgi:hypothetical protein